MSVPMVSTAKHCYEGTWLHSGDKFEANSQEDADDLRLTGFAQEDKSRARYETRVMQPALETVAATGPDSTHGSDVPPAGASNGRRAYTRRDLAGK